MNVLSLFDGMSCGQIALQRAGIKVDNYYASEIDKYAMAVTQKNFPNTIQLGDITKVEELDLPKIDLLIGGSPCQGFSFAGKQLNFDDPRSKLFFEFVRLLEDCEPKYFLLENVGMKKEYQDVITRALGVEPVFINSSLVSAQNRKRWYWTNIPNPKLPEDHGILLSDILEDGGEWAAARMVGRRLLEGKRADHRKDIPITQRIEINHDPQKSNCLSTVQKDNVLVFIGGFQEGLRLHDGKHLSRNFRDGHRVYDIQGKAATLTAQSKGGKGGYSGLYGTPFDGDIWYRKLSPMECERLQTVPDNYTDSVSNTQRFKMLGNGWTVDVVSHIFWGIQ